MNNLANWIASRIMRRDPDVIIGTDYLSRWHVIPRNRFFNIYLHKFTGSDGRIMHDHPWRSLSYMVRGYLIEYSPPELASLPGDNVRDVFPGDWVYRPPEHMHRLELDSPEAVTFFITGPIVRMWGFKCPEGWRAFNQVTTDANGCGEA